MKQTPILVAGIGNIFMGDDAFGSEVARLLLTHDWPPEVRVVDFGIRGFDLAYALLESPEMTILVDATPRGGAPGTLYTIEPNLHDLDELKTQEMVVETHGMNPLKVLAMVKSMGGEFKRILLIGCEPSPLESEEEGAMGLSESVQAAVPLAVELIGSLVARTLQELEIHSLAT